MSYEADFQRIGREYDLLDAEIDRLQAELERKIERRAQADAFLKTFISDAVVEPVADEPVIAPVPVVDDQPEIISQPVRDEPVIVAPTVVADEPVIVPEPEPEPEPEPAILTPVDDYALNLMREAMKKFGVEVDFDFQPVKQPGLAWAGSPEPVNRASAYDHLEANDRALMLALKKAAEAHAGVFMTDSALERITLENHFGLSLSRPSIRNRMSKGTNSLMDRFGGMIEEQKKPLAWRMVVTDDQEPPVDGGPANEQVVEKLELTARKRAPANQRTAEHRRIALDSCWFHLPDMTSSWTTDGRALRRLRSHPFFDMLTANLGSGWQVRTDYNDNYVVEFTTPEDAHRLVESGLIVNHRGKNFVDLTIFKQEIAAKERKWKEGARKAQRGSKHAPKFSRTVFRSPNLAKRLEEAGWAPVELKPMKRMYSKGYNPPVAVDHPLDVGKMLKTGDSPTVFERCDELDRAWEVASNPWIITAPARAIRYGYGPTIVEDAVMWTHPDDEVLIRLAIA